MDYRVHFNLNLTTNGVVFPVASITEGIKQGGYNSKWAIDVMIKVYKTKVFQGRCSDFVLKKWIGILSPLQRFLRNYVTILVV
jgi:hypothetical protein